MIAPPVAFLFSFRVFPVCAAISTEGSDSTVIDTHFSWSPKRTFQYLPSPAVLTKDGSHLQVFHKKTVKILSIRYLRQLIIGLV